MRRMISVAIACAALAPAGVVAQTPEPEPTPVHVAVESTILVLDESRVSRLALRGLEIASTGAGASAGRGSGEVRVGTRVGDLSVSAFLDMIRRERAVRRESMQSVLTLSGSAAEVSSQQALIGMYGEHASAGPSLWVEPTAMPTGEVRLRVWTAFGDVRPGPFGSAWEDVPAEARTEIIVPSGTPVMIATTAHTTQRTQREILGRGSSDHATRAWVIVNARVVGDPAEGLPMPRIPRSGGPR